jgi:hypothetical protein
MKTFDDLQNIWNQQTDSTASTSAQELIEKAHEHTKKIKRNHIGTLCIIGLTTLILIAYFFWIGINSPSLFTVGLGLMIGSLLVRIALEWKSMKRFNVIKTDIPLLEYSRLATQFYDSRKTIHYIATPIIYMVYIVGFSLLIPTFHKHFSTGFFIYLLISGYGFLIGFAFFLVKKLKQEMKILAFLKNVH